MSLTITSQAPYKGLSQAVRFAQTVVLDAGSVGGSSQTSLTGTVTGLRTDMFVIAIPPASSTNAICVGGSCVVADQLTLNYVNPAGTATPTSGSYLIVGL